MVTTAEIIARNLRGAPPPLDPLAVPRVGPTMQFPAGPSAPFRSFSMTEPLALNPAPSAPIGRPAPPSFSMGPINNSTITRPALGTGLASSPIDDIAAQTLRARAASLPGNIGKDILGRVKGTLKGGKGALGKAAILPVLGSIGANFIGDKVGGDAGGFISGAGQGAAFGSIGGPWGALAGGIVGGGLSLLGSVGNETAEKVLDKVLVPGAYMDENDVDDLKSLFQVYKETGKNDNEALELVGQTAMQLKTERRAQREQEQLSSQRQIAQQAMFSQFFKPFTQQMIDSANLRYQTMQNLLPNLPEAYRGIVEMQNVTALENATRTANAYALQSQAIPTIEALKEQQAVQRQIAQQIQAQAIAAQIQGLSGGGTGSISDLLTQQGG
jgi:hypothetical protein